MLPEQSDAKVLTKVDCSNGYWEIKLDDASSNLTTFTPRLVDSNGSACLSESLLALFERCRAKQIWLNPDKIELKKASMPYIDPILTSKGVQADPGKVKAILEMTKPTDVAGVKRILRTVNYLAKFLPQLSQISEPLRELARNGRPFAWEKAHDDVFSEIKKLISTPSVLKYYEPNKDLTLQCDASDHGLGTALIQEGKPVAFASWALTLYNYIV